MKALQTVNEPWTHYVIDDFLEPATLNELKNVKHMTPQVCDGKRIGAHGARLFISSKNKHEYPELEKLHDSFKSGEMRAYFEKLADKSFAAHYLRMEVISDIGEFYLEPHPDLSNKKLTILIYTDDGHHYPGTTIYESDGVTQAYTVEAIDNRGIAFIPADNTMHSYERFTFETVRRCLMINYFDYGDESEKV